MGTRAEFSSIESFKGCTEALGCIKNRDYEQAKSILENTIKLYPNDGILRFYLGFVLAESDQLELAREQFEIVGRSESRYAEGGRINVARITEYLTTGNVTINE